MKTLILITCPSIIKKTINASLRRNVFNRDFGYSSNIGPCFVCQSQIDRDNAHIGHIEAEYMGGKTELDNLKAICASCNLSTEHKTCTVSKKSVSGYKIIFLSLFYKTLNNCILLFSNYIILYYNYEDVRRLQSNYNGRFYQFRKMVIQYFR